MNVETARLDDRLAYPLKEAARLSSLRARTLINYIATGRLKAHRKGRRVYVMRDDLEKFLRHDDPSPNLQAQPH